MQEVGTQILNAATWGTVLLLSAGCCHPQWLEYAPPVAELTAVPVTEISSYYTFPEEFTPPPPPRFGERSFEYLAAINVPILPTDRWFPLLSGGGTTLISSAEYRTRVCDALLAEAKRLEPRSYIDPYFLNGCNKGRDYLLALDQSGAVSGWSRIRFRDSCLDRPDKRNPSPTAGDAWTGIHKPLLRRPTSSGGVPAFAAGQTMCGRRHA